MIRPKLVVGNWKMHGSTAFNSALVSELVPLLDDEAKCQVGICPPSVYLSQVAAMAKDTSLAVGAQNCADQQSGAYTGEVAAEMLLDVGCSYVIVGHSERRSLYGEDNQLVGRKAQRAKTVGLTPIVCVGETLEQRQSGDYLEIITEQLDAVVSVVGADAFTGCVVAYEPVWAIGTGETASPVQAEEVHHAIRSFIATICGEETALSTQILYGGSVKPDNAAELFGQENIDGALVGGAALKAQDFAAICRAAG